MGLDDNEPIEYTRTGKIITPQDRALDKITLGVHVITTQWQDKPYGMTAAWVTRCSNEPYLVAVNVWEQNFSHDMFKKSGVYAINVLSQGQEELAIHFGRQSGRDIDKFKDVFWRPAESGSPILYQDALAYIDCRVADSLKVGDHTLFVGQVIKAEILKKLEPLVYDRRSYP